MKRITKWFNKRDLSEEQLEEWFDRVQHIPGYVFSQIVDQIIDSHKFMPTPGDVKNLFGEYKRVHPEKFLASDQQRTDCDICDGEGRIVAWKVLDVFPYEYDFACGHCNNWKRVFPTRPSGPPAFIEPLTPMKVDDILNAGFVFKNPDNESFETGRCPVESVEDAVDVAFGDLPF